MTLGPSPGRGLFDCAVSPLLLLFKHFGPVRAIAIENYEMPRPLLSSLNRVRFRY